MGRFTPVARRPSPIPEHALLVVFRSEHDAQLRVASSSVLVPLTTWASLTSPLALLTA